MTYRETEIKLPLTGLHSVLSLLQAMGATLATERHFEDNCLLDTADQSLRNSDMLLRIRTAGESGTLTLKKKGRISDGVKDREEIECGFTEAEQLIRIFNDLGYSVTFRYQKYRTVFRFGDLDICIDETPIGNFLELEGDIEQIHACAARLGYRRDQYITDSYIALYFRWCRDHGKEPTYMTFP